MSEVEKLKNAVSLIEDMTGNRFKYGMNGPFIYPAENDYIAINMHSEADYGANVYRVSFNASLQTHENILFSDTIIKLMQEAGQAYALLSALEMKTYTPTPEDLKEFNDYIQELDEQRSAQEPTDLGMKFN